MLKKADVFTALGNCLIINEDVEGAIREYTSSLEILTQNLLPHDRKLAETYFSMGQAYKTAADFTNALVNLQKAADVFKQAIGNKFLFNFFLSMLKNEIFHYNLKIFYAP